MVGIASIPEREPLLARTLASVAPQADRVFVSLNGYDHVPSFIDGFANVDAVVREVNGGDAEKFAAVDRWDGIVVTCDDDLVYPPDYVDALLMGLARHGHDKIVGFHGGTTEGWTGAAKAATVKQIRCLGSLAEDDPDVNVLGTGAMAYDAGRVPIWRSLFRHANMADVHLACHAHRFGIRMVALAHEAGWIENILPAGEQGIYEANVAGDGSVRDTRELRKAELDRVDWSVVPAGRPRVRVSIATCERPEMLAALLESLEVPNGRLDLEVAVFEDPSDADYSWPRALCAMKGWEWFRMSERMGKERHCDLVSAEMERCRVSNADWFVFLPDDVTMIDHAIPRAIDIWDRLEDPVTLTLWRLKDHEGTSNWTGMMPVDRGDAFEIGHVDGIYLCRRELLEFFGYECPFITRRPGRRSSSGVGRSMSLELHEAGKRMYRVPSSLAMPIPNTPSVMNPLVRDRVYPWVAL